MGKKGTKRKTSWRTLSITDSTTADDATTISKNGTAEQSRDQASSKDDRYPNSSYLRRKPLFGSSGYVGRSEYAKNYYKQQNSAFSSSSSYSSRNSYHRRPFQNSASRFFNFRTAGRTGQEGNRVSDANKENHQARSQASVFNDEEYTRITTPRQDVIFKKGYLSQPRKYLSSTDTNTTSSAAASIISTEESISAASVPSLSPEQCSSYADSIDPEQAFMYSYFDQNGVFYVNPCLPNGFDQYTGQMFMLPYSYQPYSVYLSDLNSPIQSTDIEEEENPTLTDSNENLSDKEINIKEMSKKSEDLPNDCDSKPEPPKSEEQTTATATTETTSETTPSTITPPPTPAIAISTSTPPPSSSTTTTTTPPPTTTTAAITENNTEKIEENIAGNSKHIEIAPSFENYYNCGYQQFYPPVFVPYVYEQPFMPVIEPEYSGSYSECTEEDSDKKDTRRKIQNRTTHANNDGNSTGATTPDCSEEDCNDNMEDDAITIDEASCDTVIELKTPNNEETEKKIIFNANAKEFIPRLRKSHLNVNVKEFLPSNVVKPPNQGDNKDRKCSNNNDRRINSTTLKFKENVSFKKGFSVKTAKQDKSTEEKENDSKSIKNDQNDKIISNEEKTTNNLSKNIKDRLPITLTLAERIKKGLATTENNLVVALTSPSVKSSPPKHNNNNNSANTIVNKKTPRRTTTTTAATTTTTPPNDKRSANEKSPVVSFAQILTKSNHQKVTKTATSPVVGAASSISYNTNNNNNNIDKLPAKNIANNKLKIQETQTTTAEKSIVQDEWKTVKPKGKRRLFKEIAPHDELEPEKEQAYNNSSTNSSSNSSIELNKTASNATIIKQPESVPVVEKVTEKELHNGTICLNECESTSEKDQITEDDGTPNSMGLQNSQKQRTKTRNKKQKRTPNALKKVKGGEIMKQSKSNQKIDSKLMQKTNSKVIEVKDSPIAKTSYFTTPTTSSDEDLTIDSLYLLDRKNCILAKNFCKNPLEIFNGFECKFNKGNSSILKEEEEMVLSVIKSLSTNQQSRQNEEKKSSPYRDTQQTENLVNFVNTEKSNRLGNGIKLDEDDCSLESHSDHTVENESSSQLSSIENEYSVLNGNETDCVCIKNFPDQQQQEHQQQQQRQKEDIDEDTLVQTLLSIDSPVNEKISDTESISDLSSDDCGRKIGSEKISAMIYDNNDDTTDFDKNNSFEQSKKCYEEIIYSDLEGTEQNSTSRNMDTSSCLQNACCELQNNNDNFDDVNDTMTIDSITTIETKVVPNNICSAISNSEDHEYGNSDVLNTEQYESIPTEDQHNASLHDNFSQDQASNAFNYISSDLNESNFLHFDLTQFKSEKEPKEKIDIHTIFEEKLKDIEEKLSRSSSTQNSPRKMILNEINSDDNPLQNEYLPSIEALQLAAVSIDMSSVIQITNEEDSKEKSLGKIFTSEEAEEEEESRNSKNGCHFNDVSAEEVILLKASTQEEFNETKVSLKEENIVDNTVTLENVFHEENLYTNEPKIIDSKSKESLPIMKDDDFPIIEDVPILIAKDSPPIVKNGLKIADDVLPTVEDGLLILEDPIVEDALPTVEDALPMVENNLWTVKDNLPNVEDDLSIVEDGISIIEDALPTVEDILPIVQDPLRTVVEDALPIVEDALPIVEDGLPIVEDVFLIKETALSTVKCVLPIESSLDKTTQIFNKEENDYQDDGVYGNGNRNNSSANVCSNTSKSCSSPIQVDSDYGNISVVVPLEKSTSEIPEEHIENSNSSSSYISPINNSMTKENVTVITTTTPSKNEDIKNYNKIGGSIQDEIDYPEHYTSIETKEDSKDCDPSNSTIVLTTISENLDDPNKYPLTMAVKQWLNTEIKEKIPEPMFRIPKDPALNTIITTSMMEQSSQTNESCEDWSSEDDDKVDDDEDHHESKKKEKLNIENKHPKNLQSNPSHVSSVNNLLLSKSFDRKIQQNDNDSDYNSDSQQRYDEDDNTCERVAAPRNNITDIEKSERFDLLDYWDDEFVRNPKRWLDSQANNSRCPSNTDDMETQSVLSITSPSGGEFSPYQSVYGKSIDYNRLLASNYEFLSNNIISFNENSPNDNNDDMKKTRSHHRRTDNDNDDVDVIISNGTLLLNNNNNNNFGNNINGNDNCLKPPEVCCIIM